MFTRQSGCMMTRPLVSPLDRSLISAPCPPAPAPGQQAASCSLTLQRSGRTIRKIEGAPPSFARDWTVPSSNNQRESQGPVRLQVDLELTDTVDLRLSDRGAESLLSCSTSCSLSLTWRPWQPAAPPPGHLSYCPW